MKKSSSVDSMGNNIVVQTVEKRVEAGVPGFLVVVIMAVVAMVVFGGVNIYRSNTTKVSLYEHKRTVVDRSIIIDKTVNGVVPICWDGDPHYVGCRQLADVFGPPPLPQTEYIYRCQDPKSKDWRECSETEKQQAPIHVSMSGLTPSNVGVIYQTYAGVSCSNGATPSSTTTFECK